VQERSHVLARNLASLPKGRRKNRRARTGVPRVHGSDRKSGHFVGCNRLLPGPYAETKEQLGGYCIIEARDHLAEAIHVAARIPGAWIGCVEVRPIAADEPTLRALGFQRD
jgi:hypothetical protein